MIAEKNKMKYGVILELQEGLIQKFTIKKTII